MADHKTSNRNKSQVFDLINHLPGTNNTATDTLVNVDHLRLTTATQVVMDA